MKTNCMYTIEIKEEKLYVEIPYNNYMITFFKSINGKWKAPYWMISKDYYDITTNELSYCFGKAEDLPVDLKINVGTLAIYDRLFIAGLMCIEVDVVEKKFLQTSNLYIYEKYTYDNWQKINHSTDMFINFRSRLILKFFRPFKIKNCTLLLTNISQTRAQNFIDDKHNWVKNAIIIPAKDNQFKS